MVKRMQKLELKRTKDPEGELSDWAKAELARARAEPLSARIPLAEVKKRLKL